MSTATGSAGKVWIVGAGPGSPDLLTLRAARAIEQAEVLIWTDSLVNPQLAAMAPPGCERIRTSTLTLEQVMELMLDRVAAGRRSPRSAGTSAASRRSSRPARRAARDRLGQCLAGANIVPHLLVDHQIELLQHALCRSHSFEQAGWRCKW